MSRSKYRPSWHLSAAGPRRWRNFFTNRPLRREGKRVGWMAVNGHDPDDLNLTKPNRLRPWFW